MSSFYGTDYGFDTQSITTARDAPPQRAQKCAHSLGKRHRRRDWRPGSPQGSGGRDRRERGGGAIHHYRRRASANHAETAGSKAQAVLAVSQQGDGRSRYQYAIARRRLPGPDRARIGRAKVYGGDLGADQAAEEIRTAKRRRHAPRQHRAGRWLSLPWARPHPDHWPRQLQEVQRPARR